MKPKEKIIPSDEYDRYCHQIDKEDGLIDQRVNWLLASQSILFAAVGISDGGSANDIIKVIPFVGIGCSIGIGFSILAAVRSIKRYREILQKKCPSDQDLLWCYPQLHRNPQNLLLGLISPIAVPTIFVLAWIVVLVLVF